MINDTKMFLTFSSYTLNTFTMQAQGGGYTCQCVSQCRGPNCADCDDPCAPPPTGANPCFNGGTCNVCKIPQSY
jgi:hypothetical protein